MLRAPRLPNRLWLTVLLAVAWLGALGVGARAMLDYQSAPGATAAVPKRWPTSRVELATDRPTLVMLAHPRCPCTRASMGELSKIMARVPGKAVAYVLFSQPETAGADWEETDLRRSAAAIPGVTVLSDADGVEARRFGAETSGHTLVYAANGQLLFSGGITAARGHAGGNAGESAIVSLIHHGTADRAETFVFGCSLPMKPSPSRAVVLR